MILLLLAMLGCTNVKFEKRDKGDVASIDVSRAFIAQVGNTGGDWSPGVSAFDFNMKGNNESYCIEWEVRSDDNYIKNKCWSYSDVVIKKTLRARDTNVLR